ncbi:MAG: type IV pilus twitching motility protein PilT [bacterium]
MDIQQLLNIVIQYGASDLHLMVGVPPMLRSNGVLMPVASAAVLTPNTVSELVNSLLSDSQRELVSVDKELDFSYSITNGERFRVNVYHEKGNLAAALRLIPRTIRTIEDLMLPSLIGNLTTLKQGLVLVTGPTGHGKSTTLAAMIDKINRERAVHIITIEDPVEFVYTPSKSIISQREMHADTHAWGIALKSVLREDPDVVLIGEMRDYETIEAALMIAETGHLVFATLHTNSASSTVDRIVDVFPEDQQAQVRSQLAGSLEAVISQRLVPSTDGRRTAIVEILLATSAVRSNIRDGKTYMLPNVMQTSGEMGMKTLEMALAEAYLSKRISIETARDFALNYEDLARLISRGKMS